MHVCDLTLAIEIKQSGIEEDVIAMMRKYDVCKKSVVTSFMLDSIRKVRAWGVSDEELMRHVYDCTVDGMTVNFPDKLAAYMKDGE